MGKTTKAIQKSRWNKVVIMAVCICMLFFVTGCGGSDSSSSKTDGGHEKILGMEKSAVDKMYGEPVERPEAMGGHGAYIYSDKFSVHYTENGIADYMELGVAGEAFGLKLGDDTDTVQKALDKYNFEFLSMDGSIEYENSEYFIFLTPNEVRLISEFSIGLKGASSDSGYAVSSDDSVAYAESSDGVDGSKILGTDKSVVDEYFGGGDYVGDLSDNSHVYQYADFGGVGYNSNNKAVTVSIGGTMGGSGKILGLKLGDSEETVKKTLAEYGFSFVGINPDNSNAYEYQYSNYSLIVTYNEYQSVVMIVLSA